MTVEQALDRAYLNRARERAEQLYERYRFTEDFDSVVNLCEAALSGTSNALSEGHGLAEYAAMAIYNAPQPARGLVSAVIQELFGDSDLGYSASIN